MLQIENNIQPRIGQKPKGATPLEETLSGTDGFEQFLIEGKKIDLASLGPGRKEAIDEIQIGLSKKAKGL
jgi:hypothetical protein